MAYDAESDRVILFGGQVNDEEYFRDTWAYDFNTNTWTEMAPTMAPARRHNGVLAYDAESDRVILFGGQDQSGVDLNDTWAYDYNTDTWTSMSPPTAPPPRHAHRGAFDAESDRFIIVGGQQKQNDPKMRDTWAYDFNGDVWTNETAPGFGWAGYASVAYDAQADRIVHFSGNRDGGITNETWVYDYNNNTWTNRNPVVQPPPQWRQSMDYDSESDRIVLFGFDLDGPVTWAYDYDANTWAPRKPAIQPSARSIHQVTYDAESDRLILFGGCLSNTKRCLNETWAYDYNADVWTPMSPLRVSDDPPGQLQAALGADHVNLTWQPPLLTGGYAVTNYRVYRGTISGNLSLLEVVGNVLTYSDPGVTPGPTYYYQVSAVTLAGEGPRTPEVAASLPGAIPSPSARSEHDMAYDAESDRIIMFGGFGGTPLGDTWAYDYDNNKWVMMDPGTSPSARFLHAMAYDAESDRVILFGGVTSQSSLLPLNDTWAYDFNNDTWTKMNPSTKPPARWGRMAYDAESDRVILFGGASGHLEVVFNDTWAYDFNANSWRQMSSRPSRGTSHAMAYDAESDRIVVFGGQDAQGPEVGTWSYHFNNDSWTLTTPTPEPPLGIHYTMVYDRESDRVILWVGLSLDGFFDNVWAYDVNTDTWTPMPEVAGPSERHLQRMAYDVESDRVVMFGGVWPPPLAVPEFNNETWAYDLNSNTWTALIMLPSEPLNLTATAAEGQVALSWEAPADAGSHAIVKYQTYRRNGGPSAPLAAVESGLTFTDTNVTGGTTYYYEVRAVTAVGEGPPSDEVCVRPPVAPPPPDTTDPTITIGAPQEGQTFNNVTVSVTGTASDDVGLEKIELSTDGVTWQPATGLATWSGTLTLSEGVNTITARATDTSGNMATDVVNVTVELIDDTPPPPPPLLLIAGAGGAAGIAIVVVLLLLRRRGKAG